MPALDKLRIAVTATDEVEEPKLAEPVSALRELGARTELLSLKPPGDVPAFIRGMLNRFAAARGA